MYKIPGQGSIVSRHDMGDRVLGDDGAEIGGAQSHDLPGVQFGSKVPQCRQQTVLEHRLPQRNENGGAKVLTEDHERGADRQLLFRKVGLDGRDGLLRHHAPSDAVEELEAHPGGHGGVGGEGGHEPRRHGCRRAAHNHERGVVAEFGDCERVNVRSRAAHTTWNTK